MLSKKIITMISEQIKKEFESAYFYLEVSDYFQTQGLLGFANWFFIQSREEVEHAMLFLEFLHTNRESVQFYEIEPSRKEFSEIEVPIEIALIHEEFITQSIYKIYEEAMTEKDYRTEHFLAWFIKEQTEEESSINQMYERAKLFGDSMEGIYLLDKEFLERDAPDCRKIYSNF